jgi:hypothetical protein
LEPLEFFHGLLLELVELLDLFHELVGGLSRGWRVEGEEGEERVLKDGGRLEGGQKGVEGDKRVLEDNGR